MVLVAHGALFGVKVGTLLSLVGSTGATLVGFGIGRRSKPLIASLGWVRTTLAALAGSLPAALLFAMAGAVTA